MKLADMHKKSAEDLTKHARKLRQNLAESKRDRYTTETTNVKAIKNIRRELARTLTVANMKQGSDDDKNKPKVEENDSSKSDTSDDKESK